MANKANPRITQLSINFLEKWKREKINVNYVAKKIPR